LKKNKMMQKTALITGATSGIGMATATKFAEAGFKLIITGRREARLKKLAEKLSELSDVITLNFDVRDKEKVFEMLGNLPSAYQNIDILINNAGNAHGLGAINQGDIKDWEAMLDINVKGLLYVSKAVMPGMVQRKNGHIINIGSIAGKEVYPNGNVYCASKHAVDAISKAMRIDLNIHNIKVSEINPGLVETEFSEVRFKGDKAKAKQVYQGYKALQAEDIADLIHFMVTRPAHVNLAEVLILPTAQANAVTVRKE
jgi:NADP-dependent 3-hydroxy acid dehydrogenase YdfG